MKMKDLIISYRNGKTSAQEVLEAALKDNTVGTARQLKAFAPNLYIPFLKAKGIKNADTEGKTGTALVSIKGIGPKTAELLQSLGIPDAEALATADLTDLSIKLQAAGSKLSASSLIEFANNF
jgi:predicted flap endonuclease-1-like 5' DNA nuclease